MKGDCSICGFRKRLPFETPADPPFYPAEGGRHCARCQGWLLTGRKHWFARRPGWWYKFRSWPALDQCFAALLALTVLYYVAQVVRWAA